MTAYEKRDIAQIYSLMKENTEGEEIVYNLMFVITSYSIHYTKLYEVYDSELLLIDTAQGKLTVPKVASAGLIKLTTGIQPEISVPLSLLTNFTLAFLISPR